MNRRRIGDLVLGATMVVMGVTPLGLVATGRARLAAAPSGFGALPGNLGSALTASVTLCGLVLAVAGMLVMKHGRSESNSTTLY